jgi:hypothetical protein
VTLEVSHETLVVSGILLITIVTVEWGGTAVLSMVRGSVPATDFQLRFARAGHAHAGVLIILSLISQLYADAAGMHGFWCQVAHLGAPIAAILFPLGFFLSSGGKGTTKPNSLIWFVYIGAVVLAAGVLSLGVGLLAAA